MIEVTIKEAKRLILEGVYAYREKDEYGEYLYPQNKQRPIYLEGPAGIGKTELVKQIADELEIGFISYSMTHHTRQSVIGLPAIVEKSFDNTDYKATEYTMSEIIEAVRDCVREGYEEGILFLDEVNCISETLTAAMLQFLQNKTFGQHRIPEGWIIIAAGNPPEYNKSVKRFDAVTRDRMRILHLKPDLESWLQFARENGIHPLIIQFLESNSNEFYQFDRKKEGGTIVTARGWEDLSRALYVKERCEYPIDEAFVNQFIQKEETAAAFTGYYQIARKNINREDILEILQRKEWGKHLEKMTGMDKQKKWTVMLLVAAELENESRKIRGLLKMHDRKYEELKVRMKKEENDPSSWVEREKLEDEKEKFRKQTTNLEQCLDKLENYVNAGLEFQEKLFEDNTERDLLVTLLCENKHVMELMLYRKFDKLVDRYMQMTENIDRERRKVKKLAKLREI